jgi:hypothetical protein
MSDGLGQLAVAAHREERFVEHIIDLVDGPKIAGRYGSIVAGISRLSELLPSGVPRSASALPRSSPKSRRSACGQDLPFRFAPKSGVPRPQRLSQEQTFVQPYADRVRRIQERSLNQRL